MQGIADVLTNGPLLEIIDQGLEDVLQVEVDQDLPADHPAKATVLAEAQPEAGLNQDLMIGSNSVPKYIGFCCFWGNVIQLFVKRLMTIYIFQFYCIIILNSSYISHLFANHFFLS